MSVSMPTIANSSCFMHRESRNSQTLPFSRHFMSRKRVQSSVCANMPFWVNSMVIASQCSFTDDLFQTHIKAESGSFCVSKDLAECLSFSHFSIAVCSSAVGADGSAGEGDGVVPESDPRSISSEQRLQNRWKIQPS